MRYFWRRFNAGGRSQDFERPTASLASLPAAAF
jgi:hypothetical protein